MSFTVGAEMKTPYELAKDEVGTKEIVGDRHNPVVLGYFADAGHPEIVDDETAWCAAFMGAMLKRSGLKNTGSLAARSYMKWGSPIALSEAMPGDIVVFQRGDSAWQGHVGFYVKHDDYDVWVLGGNQANAVNVSKYRVSKLLGVRRASPVTVAPQSPSPAKKPGSGAVSVGIGGAIAATAAALVAKWHDFIAWIGG